MDLRSFADAFAGRVEREGLACEGVIVSEGFEKVAERRWSPDRPRNIYSHTKSFTATAAGIAIAEGKLSLSDTLADCFPESVPENADERIYRITLRDLLTMSSGFGKPYLMGGNGFTGRRGGEGMPDLVGYMLSRPIKENPGERFEYSTADSILAGRMIEKKTGVMLQQYVYERILRPMGLPFPIWECCPIGHAIGGGGMFLRLAEMMTLGQLYLNGGVWSDGASIVPREFIAEATKKQIDNEDGKDYWRCGYGYQFWLSPYPDSYRADGAFGQITTVLPREGAVIAIQCPEEGDFGRVRLALHEEISARI